MAQDAVFIPDSEGYKSSNFFLPMLFLPQVKREAIATIYHFCRYTDDIVDDLSNDAITRRSRLLKWSEELQRALGGRSESPFLNKLNGIIHRFRIPEQPFIDLIRGMEMDLVWERYNTYEDLELYCYRVASTVGLMCAEVFGYRSESAKEYAILLGKALQLTNVLRDVKQDARNGRIYLPREDMKRFGYSEEDLMNSVYDERFVALMQFEAGRAYGLFAQARKSLSEDDKQSFATARAMGTIYYSLLRKMEEKRFDVFSSRIRLNIPYKLGVVMLLGLRNLFPRSLRRRLPQILPV